MKPFLFVLLITLAAPAAPTAPTLRAQKPADTSAGAEAKQLRHQVRQRWSARVRQDLKLSDDQATKLQATEQKFMQQRAELAERQRAVHDALRAQLQPGVAANSDSVRKLMDARDRNRAALPEIDRNESQEMSGYLTPVQLARYEMMRDQLRGRIDEVRKQRRGRDEKMGPRRGTERPREPKP
jgi:Spy/CpxP family protein refolding chaperone